MIDVILGSLSMLILLGLGVCIWVDRDQTKLIKEQNKLLKEQNAKLIDILKGK